MKQSTNILFAICAVMAGIGLVAGFVNGRIDTIIIAGLFTYVAAGFRKSYQELKKEAE